MITPMNGRKDVVNLSWIECVDGVDVHRCTHNDREIHRRYGMCIMGCTVAQSPANGFLATRKRRFEFYSLSHLIEGRGRLWLEPDTEIDILQGDVVLICPGIINRYGGYAGERYTEEVITFYGPVPDMLRAAGVLRSGIYRLGNDRPLTPIIATAADPADSAQINANIALQHLLVELYNRKRSNDTKNDSLEELVAGIKKSPERWWTVGEMSEICGLSSNQLRRNFVKRTGLLPKEYIEHVKLRRASELLMADEKTTIAEIASRLGYADMYHFSKRFKELFKVSPTQYREQFTR